MKKTLIKAVFILLALASFWIGCYFLNETFGTWAHFPTYVTMIVSVCSFIMACAFYGYEND